MKESNTSKRRLDAAERQRQALELRKAGASFPQIADKLGYGGPSGAYNAVEAALQKTLQEPADEVRKMEIERLDVMWMALYPQVRQGNFGAIDRGLKVMERRDKLLGLDAPIRNDLTLRNLDLSKLSSDKLERIAAGEDILQVVLDVSATQG